eukprot:GFUD01126114.1.p1 GENE.GFUD01126114.1~~GFUD01126114.1.p1  ORF type:complete len:101 (-),score=2.04 GFUD01126114.1:186-488(-)
MSLMRIPKFLRSSYDNPVHHNVTKGLIYTIPCINRSTNGTNSAVKLFYYITTLVCYDYKLYSNFEIAAILYPFEDLHLLNSRLTNCCATFYHKREYIEYI